MKRMVLILVLLIGQLAATRGSRADGIIIPVPPPGHPSPVAEKVRVKYHHVTVRIDDQVATTHVDQVFVNDNGYELEGEYLFPMPKDGALSRFVMWVDGHPVEAQILEREEARALYEQIVQARLDPALLEYVGRGAFRVRIYPIPPQGERRIEIEYSQILPREHGLVHYSYPLSIERFSSAPIELVSVTIDVTSQKVIRSAYSPSHEIAIKKHSEKHWKISYADQDIVPDKDVVLYYGVGDGDTEARLLSYLSDGEDGYFLLLLTPPDDSDKDQAIPKDVILVVDVSGSMRGEKLEQVRGAVQFVLGALGAGDGFGVVAFGSGVNYYANKLSDTSRVEDALAFVASLRAGGGTNIALALEEALKMAALDSERPQIILFLTDGLPTEGEQRLASILARVNDSAGGNVRIFTFGVGYDVNTTLLDTLAQQHHGTSTYVRPGENIEHAVSELYSRIDAPLLLDASLDLGKSGAYDVFPYPLPDVFAGQQIIVLGRYRTGGNIDITLEGKSNGRVVRQEFQNLYLSCSGGETFIPRLWAMRKIGHMLTQIRLYGMRQELVDEITELGLRYGIATPYTSFLIDETEDLARQPTPDQLASHAGGQGPTMAVPRIPWAMGSTGRTAVEQSIIQETLRTADRDLSPMGERIRVVGAKSFVWHNGVWTDTTYDPKKMTPQRIAFGSPSYFEILRQHVDWGPYLALGSRVILVIGDQAYEIFEQGREDSLTPPPTTPASTPRIVPTATPPTATTALPTIQPSSTPNAKSLWQLLKEWLSLG